MSRDIHSLEAIKAEARSLTRMKRKDAAIRVWRAFSQLPLGPTTAVIRGTIGKGDAEGRPFDASSLAAFLDLPRTTVYRALKQLDTAGAIERSRDGRRLKIVLTEVGWRQVAEGWSIIDPVIDQLLRQASDILDD